MYKELNIIYLDKIDSTNKYALRNFEELPDSTLVVATEQSKGRGRHTRQWVSPPNTNIYASMIIKNIGKKITKLVELQKWCLKNKPESVGENRDGLVQDISGFEASLKDVVGLLKLIKKDTPEIEGLITNYAKDADNAIDDIELSIRNYQLIKDGQ